MKKKREKKEDLEVEEEKIRSRLKDLGYFDE